MKPEQKRIGNAMVLLAASCKARPTQKETQARLNDLCRNMNGLDVDLIVQAINRLRGADTLPTVCQIQTSYEIVTRVK